MKAHTLIFKNNYFEHVFYLGLNYNSSKKEYGSFLAINTLPPIYSNLFEYKNGYYIYANGSISIPKHFNFDVEKKKNLIFAYPHLGNVLDLKNIILGNSSNLLFYTGAGLSKSAGIMDLSELQDSLYLNNLYDLNKMIIENPILIKKNGSPSNVVKIV